MHKRDDFAFPGLCIFPFTRGVEKLCSTPKVEKAGTSDLQQRGATFYIAALYFFEISYGLGDNEVPPKSFSSTQGWELTYANFAAAVI